MSTAAGAGTPPRVAGVLVVHNGAEWLPGVLATLARVRYPALELVAVDTGSTDGSRELLEKRFEQDRIISLPADASFGRAVAAAAAQVEAVASADYLLLLHDDLILAPRALQRMVRALETDPTLDIVGPKLREWSSERVLQEVGMTVDRLGRAEAQVELGELDQGQHDVQREVLYVSTAGMLLRREVLREVGGFDARYTVFRDDLDLCWRAWLAGRRVEIVPRAVGYHLAAASRLARPVGAGRPWEARYLAERHTLATLLKNYGLARLAWVVPVVVLVGLLKVAGFLATRRFGDALATAAAWAWNLAQLPRTLRRRQQVQRRRAVSDGELMRLFAPGLPRLRSYGEALGSWLAGGSTRALLDEPDGRSASADDLSGLRALVRSARAHPAVTVGVLLLIGYLVGVVPLLGAGQLVGGDIAPWPEDPGAFLADYVSAWSGEPLASSAFASPIQAVLGLVSLAGLGSAWVAQRLVVLGLLPLAWLLALRAGRLITARPGPRVLGATLYVLSPVTLGGLAQGRLGVLLVAALLPGLLLVGVRTSDGTIPQPAAWRAAALLALGLAVAAAAEPALLPLIAVLPVVLILASLARRRDGRRQATVRLVTATGLGVLLLSPWLVELVRLGWRAVTSPAAVGDLPLWRALGTVPDVVAGVAGPAGMLVAVMAAAVIFAALLFGMRVRPAVVSGLALLWVLSALAAWGLVRLGVDAIWPPAVLLPAALAQAGLGVLAARWLTGGLAEYEFGLRQVTTVVVVGVLAVGLTGSFLRLANGPWVRVERAPELVPVFVAADAERVGPYRVLLMRHDEDGVVRWDVTGAGGPSMTEFGTVPNRALLGLLDEAVATAIGGVEPVGGGHLGAANVRYVVVPETGFSDELVAALNRQPALEPAPAGGSRVWRVRSWLPRAVVLPADRAAGLSRTGDPGATDDLQDDGLRMVRRNRYAGPNPQPDGGVLVLSEGDAGAWTGLGDGRRLERAEVDRLNAYTVPPGVSRVVVEHAGSLVRTLVLVLQALLALGIVSVALRPPGSAPRRLDAAGGELPESLAEAADDDTTGEHPVIPAGVTAARPRTEPAESGSAEPAPGPQEQP